MVIAFSYYHFQQGGKQRKRCDFLRSRLRSKRQTAGIGHNQKPKTLSCKQNQGKTNISALKYKL